MNFSAPAQNKAETELRTLNCACFEWFGREQAVSARSGAKMSSGRRVTLVFGLWAPCAELSSGDCRTGRRRLN